MIIDFHKELGYRLSLDHLAQHKLNRGKSADGLVSIEWFTKGGKNRKGRRVLQAGCGNHLGFIPLW